MAQLVSRDVEPYVLRDRRLSLVRALPAAKLIATLVEETRAALAEAGSLEAVFAMA